MTSSIFDTPYKDEINVVLMYHSIPEELQQNPRWLWKRLQPGFHHVQCWTLSNGVWVQLDGTIEYLYAKVYPEAPWEMLTEDGEALNPTFQAVSRLVPRNKWREPWHFGPMTCVEFAKAILGIRAVFVRTPYQLYKYLERQRSGQESK